MQLSTLNNQLTMSSKEIAELTNKEHKNVLADIRKLLTELNLATANFSAIATVSTGNSGSKQIEVFNLPKRECLILVSGYSIGLRAKIIDRWQELENQTQLTVFGHDTSTHRGALLALVASLDKIEADKPKVQYFDNLVERNLLTNLRDTAKELYVKQNEFIGWLLGNKYLYRDAKNQLKPYSKYTPDLFELKEFINRYNNKAGSQLLVTPKGRETFSLLLTLI